MDVELIKLLFSKGFAIFVNPFLFFNFDESTTPT